MLSSLLQFEMHYGRGGSVGDASSAIAGGYDSEYADSPPDTSSVAHRQATAAAAAATYQHHPTAYAHTPPSLEMTYANGQMIHSGTPGPYYPHSSYTNPAAAAAAAAGTHEAAAYAPSAGSYAYYEEEKPNTRDYPSPNTARAFAAGPGQTTWAPSYGGYNSSASSRPPRHSDSPPLSPIDTRHASYFPTNGRDYPLSAVTSSSAASGNVPSSPTTPSSLSDSPSTPFSPQYASPYGHGHSHSHSHSASSTASASAYVPGMPLPPLNSSGGHFVPPSGGDYAVPATSSAYSTTQGYGRSSPPETRLPPPAPQVQPSGPTPVVTAAAHQQPNPFAGPGFAARPFLCDDCGMNFARTHDLKRHQTTHIAGVKKTHPCPYCGKNLSRRDAIKRHVVSKQCPVAADKPHLTWPPPADHVPPPPDTVIERTTHRRGENPYPVLSSNTSASDRSHSAGYSSSPYSSTSPTSPGPSGGHFSPSGYSSYAGGNPGGHTLPPPAGYEGGGVVFEYDPRSSGYKGR